MITNGASGNTIGGTTAAARDVISGNLLNGVALSGTTTTGNVVEGDYIGTNAAGGRRPGQWRQRRLLLGGARQHDRRDDRRRPQRHLRQCRRGVWITSGASDEVIEGNYIGTDTTGLLALPNDIGVRIDAASRGQHDRRDERRRPERHLRQ